MYYRIWYVADNKLQQGAWWPLLTKDDVPDLDLHILGFLENYPGEFYDIEYKEQ